MEYLPLDEDMSSTSAAFTTAVRRNGGYCDIPDAPGLGISLVDDHARIAPVLDRPLTDVEPLRADGSVATAN